MIVTEHKKKMATSSNTAKHSTHFPMEVDRQTEMLYDDLGIIGEIRYDEPDEANAVLEKYDVLRTPHVKRPISEKYRKCHTPEKPRRLWRLSKSASFNPENGEFRCHHVQRSTWRTMKDDDSDVTSWFSFFLKLGGPRLTNC